MEVIMQMILILGPGIIAAKFYTARGTDKQDTETCIYNVSKFTLIIFWFMNGIQYIRGWNTFNWTNFSVQFLVKYIPLALMFSILIPLINLLLSKKIKNSLSKFSTTGDKLDFKK